MLRWLLLLDPRDAEWPVKIKTWFSTPLIKSHTLDFRCVFASWSSNPKANLSDHAELKWIYPAAPRTCQFRVIEVGVRCFWACTCVPGIYHRTSRSCFSTHAHLHFKSYELLWQPDEGAEPVHVHSKLFISEVFIQAHCELQDSPGELECDLLRVVLGLMFASDGTQLTSFSTAKLWPVYAMIENESKDRRSKPSCHAFEHGAYLEMVHKYFTPMLHGPYLFSKLPDAFTTFAAENISSKGPNPSFLAHRAREMYHAQWSIILNDEFLEAYKHRMLVKCYDQISHHFYPCIFTNSADYKKK